MSKSITETESVCSFSYQTSNASSCGWINITRSDSLFEMILVLNHTENHSNDDITVITSKEEKLLQFPTIIFEQFKNLTEIRLETCSMEEINNPFFNCNKLNSLYLRQNKLTYINKGIFQNCTNITTIHISYNQITEVHPQAFQGLIKLSNLALSNNKITEFDPNLLKDNKEISFIYFTDNSLQKLPKDLCSVLPKNLVDLIVARNEISELQTNPSSFIHCDNFKELYLYSNKLKKIKNGMFEGLKSIELLELHDNQILSIENNAFDGIENLEKITLDNNKLIYLNSKLFLPTPKIKTIRIHNNPFQAISYDFLNSLPNLENLSLENCACIDGSFMEFTSEVIKQFEQCFAEIVSCKFINDMCEIDGLKIDNKDTNKRIVVDQLELESSVSNLFTNENSFMSFIPLEIFEAFPEVKFINFSGVGLTNLRNLEDCNNCGKFEKLIFNNNNLNYSSIPSWDLFPNLMELSFEHNNLTKLQTLFSSDSIKHLNLANNKISDIYIEYGFMPNLEYLDLSSNKIQMNSFWFSKFEALTTLDLSNQLDEGPDNTLPTVFKMTEKLKKLFLSNRKIKSIQNFEFNNLTEVLDLSKNFIGHFVSFSVPDGVLGLEYIKVLNLSFNSFELFDIRILKTLEILDLSNNGIKKLDSSPFENNQLIREIYLDGNFLKILYSNSFVGLINLEILSISYNVLKVIETNTFSMLESLQKLNLDNNDLQTLSTDEFGGNLPQNLEFISIKSNSLQGISKHLNESLPSNADIYLDDNPCSNDAKCIEESVITCEYIYNNGLYMCIINEAKVVGYNYPYKIKGNHTGSSTNENVKVLKAQANSLFKFIPNVFFEEFTHLTTVIFDGKGLEYLNDFFNCNQLRIISVERNRLSTLSKTIFGNCTLLELINLEDNLIYSFGDGILNNLMNLKYFNFGKNDLTRITKDFFTYNKNLESLIFHNNFIKELPESTFVTLKNLKNLSIRGNPIEILYPNLLKSLENLEEFEMQSLNLSQIIPSDLFNNSLKLRKLLMNNNNIHLINKTLLNQQRKLEILDLSYCNTLKIEKNSFENLESLKILQLNENQIEEIDENLLLNVSNLSELYLQYNNIKILESTTIKTLRNLKILKIDHNKIDEIKTGVFANLERIENLDFSSNQISIIYEQTFENNSEITTLNFDSNQINNLNRNIFKNLKKIEVLKINFNKIEIVEEDTFKNLTSLKELSLHDNQIQHLHSKMFENCTNLENIDLSMNFLTSINANIFNSTLHNLQEINFANNLIENIETKTFQRLTNLVRINLQNNLLTALTANMFIDQAVTSHKIMSQINISHNLINKISSDFFKFISVMIFDAINNTCLNNNYKNLNSLSDLDEFKNCSAKILECSHYQSLNKNCEISGLSINDNEIKLAQEVEVYGISASEVEIVRITSSNISFIPSILFETFQNLQVLEAENIFLKRLETIKNCTNLRILILDLNSNLELGESNLVNCVNLQKLSINKIKLTVLNVLAFKGLNNLEELFMEDSNVVDLNYIPNSMKILRMTRNNLKIGENTFKNLVNLEQLFIDESNNSFDQISLYNLKKLKVLNISKRKIKNLNFPSFDSRNNLEILISNENEIEKLNEEILKNLTNLIELEMMDNLINEIEITTFRNCMKLKILNLENRAKSGRINSLKSGTFSSLINLEVLQLGGHQISSISSRIFENLPNLKLLSLKKNKITQIDGQAFTALIKLENLDLSENNFNYLPSNVFINLHNIENLNLKSCQLKEIPSSIINLKTLKFFDISQNQLPWLLFYPSFENLESFDFYSNKITAINPKFFNEIFLNESIPSSSFNLNQCENRNDCSYQFNNLHFCNIEKDKKFEYSCRVDKFEIKKSTYTRDVVKYLENKNKPLDIQVFELFELYGNVSTVQLWNSDITDIYGIKSCSNLKFFDLRMNKIENLYESSLTDCRKLETLILVKNRISFIDEKFFASLGNLKFLDLSQNQIGNLRNETFKNNTNLQKLFLNHNKISITDRNLFINLINLKILKLNHNSIKQLRDIEHFKNLNSLLELYINHNQISEINEEIFNACKKLKFLNIEQNQLTEINLDKMSLKYLEYFDVSSNQISTFRGNFDNMHRLKTFIAENNSCIDKNFDIFDKKLFELLPNCIDKTKVEL